MSEAPRVGSWRIVHASNARQSVTRNLLSLCQALDHVIPGVQIVTATVYADLSLRDSSHRMRYFNSNYHVISNHESYERVYGIPIPGRVRLCFLPLSSTPRSKRVVELPPVRKRISG